MASNEANSTLSHSAAKGGEEVESVSSCLEPAPGDPSELTVNENQNDSGILVPPRSPTELNDETSSCAGILEDDTVASDPGQTTGRVELDDCGESNSTVVVSTWSEIECESVRSLTHKLMGARDQCDDLVKERIFPMFIELLEADDNKLVEQVLLSLIEIAKGRREHCDIFIRGGILSALTRHINSDASTNVLKTATQCLTRLVAYNIATSSSEIVTAGLSTINNLLECKSDPAVSSACVTLLEIINTGSDQHIEQIVRMGVLDRLVQLVRVSLGRNVVRAALQILCDISLASNWLHADMIIDRGVLVPLKRLLTHAEPNGFEDLITMMLMFMTKGPSTERGNRRISAVIHAGLVQPVCRLILRHEDAEVQQFAVTTVVNIMSFRRAEQIQLLLDNGSLAELVECVAKPNLSDKLRANVVSALANVVHAGDEANLSRSLWAALESMGLVRYLKNIVRLDDNRKNRQLLDVSARLLSEYWRSRQDRDTVATLSSDPMDIFAAIQDLIHGIHSANLDTVLNATYMLRLFSSEPDFPSYVFASLDTIPRLIELALEGNCLEVQSDALAVLNNVATAGPFNRDSLIKHGIVPVLIQLVHRDIPNSILWAVSQCMASLFDHFPFLPPGDVMTTCLPSVKRLLMHESVSIVWYSNVILWAMTSEQKAEYVQQVVDLNVFDRLVQIVNVYAHHAASELSLQILASIAVTSKEHAQTIIRRGVMSVFKRLLLDDRTLDQYGNTIMWAFAHITAHGDELNEAIIGGLGYYQEFVSILGKCLVQNTDRVLQKNALQVVHNLTHTKCMGRIEYLTKTGTFFRLVEIATDNADTELSSYARSVLKNINQALLYS